MKRIFYLIWFVVLSGSALAQPIGIDFAKMPVGLQVHYLSSGGEKRVNTFLGRKGKVYRVKTVVTGRRSGNFTARQEFDLQGRRIRWTGNTHLREKWLPFDCLYQLGDCTHKISSNYGSNSTWTYRATRKGNQLTVVRKTPREPEFRRPWSYTLGKYNLRMTEKLFDDKGVSYWRKITKIVEP